MLHDFDFWKFSGGLGLFLFGLLFIEEALKNLAGRPFKKILRQHTTNPFKGVLWGTAITALVQSSSVVSLMVLAFVGAGILKLKNAIGIIFGSNLGTTFTGWIVVFLGFKLEIESIGLPMAAIGGISLVSISRQDKLKEVARFLLGFGFLFIGLDYMKSSIDMAAAGLDLSDFNAVGPYIYFPIGFILTAIIHSSSAANVITLSALNAGLIPIEAAAVMVIGNDLGTTMTVLLGAARGIPSKKRVALSHFLFNLIADFIALVMMYPLLSFISQYLNISDPLFIIVMFHSMFNLIGIGIMLPFIGLFASFLEKRFEKDENKKSIYLSKVPASVPEAALEALNKEIKRLIEYVFYLNINGLRINQALFNYSDEIKKEKKNLFAADIYPEEYASVKQLEGEIISYCVNVQNEKLEAGESEKLNNFIHAVRNAMIASKEIKDISHNIKELENSSNDSKRALYLYLKGRLNEFYLSLHRVFHSETRAAHFEQLTDRLMYNQKIYQDFLKEIYRQIEKNSISDLEISTMLNVNREVYNANRSLIMAIKDILLEKSEAESFNSIPSGIQI